MRTRCGPGRELIGQGSLTKVNMRRLKYGLLWTLLVIAALLVHVAYSVVWQLVLLWLAALFSQAK